MAVHETLTTVLERDAETIVAGWVTRLDAEIQDGRIAGAEVRDQARKLLKLMSTAAAESLDAGSAAWAPVRGILDDISRTRAVQGFTSSETATFVFSMKQPLFAQIRAVVGDDPAKLAELTWTATELIDRLGLHTVASFQKTREEIIKRQQEELLELSTPVVKLWDGVLALPMIGTLDSARTQVVMEALLQRIVETGAETAIIDITGVPTVDTLVAQHLLKTVSAIRLMGADCIISGIRPQIAQTIVHLGLELQGVTTKATLADALALALKRSGLTVTKVKPA
ncbi:MAG TPA: STAS domain-containing protein [Luteitalea sp.]|nr:STAS domain-containing protein [Luteitalea sp.]